MKGIKKRIALTGWLFSSLTAIRKLAASGLFCILLAGSGLGISTSASAETGGVTNLADLVEAASSDQIRVIPVQLSGLVWWSNENGGRVILHDDSATVQLELSLPCRMPDLGDRLVLEGKCAVVKARDAIVLSSVPVVENNGLHAFIEKSGTVHLEAGRHPIQVAWFNRTDRFGLEVEYEGPEMLRQNIPDSELFHIQVEPNTGATNFANGLDFRNFEGQWWRLLPNFDHLDAEGSGVADNFDIEVRSRESHVGLQFTGFINIPRSGDYRFYVRSDDGSRLFIGPPSLIIQTKGSEALPSLLSVAVHGVSSADPEFLWSEIEGNVTAVRRSNHGLELELMTETGLVRVKVAEDSAGSLALRPHIRIRAIGVSRRSRNPAGNWVRGEFFAQRLKADSQQQDGSAIGEATEGGNLPLLTSIEQVYQLSHEESSRKYPVKIRGVITSPLESNGAALQDAVHGIYVALNGPINLQVGDYCEVEGTTGPYQFSHYIEATRVEVLGAGVLPEPVEPSWDQLINGSLHCNYVELEGVVASVGDDGIALLTRDGRINVRLNPEGAVMPHDALGATVRLRGCLLADWDGASRRVMVGSIYLDQSWVTVVAPAPEDPFRVRYKRVDDLLQFDPEAGALQHVRVYGVLVHKGRDVSCLMDGASGLRFVPTNGIDAEIGDMVDVAGFLELGGATPVLREAIARQTSHAGLPEPVPLAAEDLLSDSHDATYVKVGGVLLGVTEREDSIAFELQNGLRRFEAELEGTFDAEALVPGNRLELTGTYIGQGGNRVLGRPIDSFKILLNSDANIVVLSRPPWWTLQRMLTVVGLLAAVLVAALFWIKLLHREVEERTHQLGDQIRQRQRAERHSEIEKERTRVSNDLHDELGASLTEVNMLTSLIKSPIITAEEKERYVDELNERAQRMVTSLDEIVWALNPRNDKVTSLAVYFCSYARQFLELASVGFGFDVSENLPDEPLDPKFRRELFYAFREALTNIVRHADATKVWLRIEVQEGTVAITVADDGRGIQSGKPEPGADGLLNMQNRMRALGGKCLIQSDPETGTSVRLEAPIQKALE